LTTFKRLGVNAEKKKEKGHRRIAVCAESEDRKGSDERLAFTESDPRLSTYAFGFRVEG